MHAAAKHVVVHEAREHREQAHAQDHVAAIEEHRRDLVEPRAQQPALIQHHRARHERHEQAMAHVAKHDGEHERKRDHRKQARIHLLVPRIAVRVNDRLEALCHLVRPLVRRRRLLRPHRLHHRRHMRAGRLGRAAQRELHARQRRARHPPLGDHRLAAHVRAEQVHRAENQLLATHEVVPRANRLGDTHELSPPRRVRRVQDILMVLDPLQHLPQVLAALQRITRHRVQRAAHRLTYLADLAQHRRAVRKDHKHILIHRLLARRVLQRLLDLGIVHVQVAAQRPPQDPLERRHLRPLHRARHKLDVHGARRIHATHARALLRQQRRLVVHVLVHTHPHGRRRFRRLRLGLLEKRLGLVNHMLRLFQLQQPPLQRVVTPVHLRHARLVLLEPPRELLEAHRPTLPLVRGEERDRTLQRPRWHRLALQLRLQELQTPLHLVQPPDLGHKRPLERRHVRIQVAKLHMAQLAQLMHRLVHTLRRNVHLDQRHGRRAEQALVAHRRLRPTSPGVRRGSSCAGSHLGREHVARSPPPPPPPPL